MKKLIFAVLLLMISCLLFAEADYRGGNGTLLRKETIGNKIIEIRKFYISGFQAGRRATVYDDYLNKNIIGNIELDKKIGWADIDYVELNFYEICFITDSKNTQKCELWVKLSDGKITGWADTGLTINPYENGHYSYLENIVSGSKTYQIRKYDFPVIWDDLKGVDNSLAIRDKPGNNAQIIAEAKWDGSIQSFNATAITEEYIEDNGYQLMDGYWVKIEYEKGKYGWAFSDYYHISGLGWKPFFNIPEDIVLFDFEFQWVCPY